MFKIGARVKILNSYSDFLKSSIGMVGEVVKTYPADDTTEETYMVMLPQQVCNDNKWYYNVCELELVE